MQRVSLPAHSPGSRFSGPAFAALLALVVLASSSMVAAQGGERTRSRLAASAATPASVEETLAEVGLDAAWRSVLDLHPGAASLPVVYQGTERDAVDALVATAADLTASAARHDSALADLRETAGVLAEARATERDLEIERNRADVYFQGIHALTARVAVDKFAGSDPTADALLGLDSQALVVAQREFELAATTLDGMIEMRTAAEIDLANVAAALDDAIADRGAIEVRHHELVLEVARLATERRSIDTSARAIIPDAAAAYSLGGISGQPGMTPRALSAYLRAEETLTTVSAGCGISWRTIAAVASVEGLHGQYGGRRLGADGRPDDPILGIALNGATVDNFGTSTANIADSDGGRYDGDPVYDRAVGPLQFIPQTWERWKQDGDGDGEYEPQDIDDAALAAGAYLCYYGSHRTWDIWVSAIFGYNHSNAYVNSVKSSLDRVLGLQLPSFSGDRSLQPPAPAGEWVELEPEPPEDEENPDEGEDPDAETPTDPDQPEPELPASTTPVSTTTTTTTTEQPTTTTTTEVASTTTTQPPPTTTTTEAPA